MKLLENKTVIITGASRGIGKSIAILFASHGANIAFTFLKRDENVEILEKKLNSYAIKAIGYVSDASNFEDSLLLAENVMTDFDSIDVLVNNAGITKDNLLMRMSENDFNSVMQVNMNSVFNLTKACLKTMLKQRSGSIINMSSVVGVKGNAGQANYSASKAAINGFTKSTALELGSRNIRCNSIAPGFIETEMTSALGKDKIDEWAQSIPLRRNGSPNDVANVSLFLASDMSSYVTGQVINVCGGMLT
jgi:3-oxoacyl-[acyl-carrier protein] reductase